MGTVTVTTAAGTFTTANKFTPIDLAPATKQQSQALFGAGTVPNLQTGTREGSAVAISADGNTAIVGAPDDNNFEGSAHVYVRSGGMWTQQGPKLVGSGAMGPSGAQQGTSVALSGDGNTALVGGPIDNNGRGAAWVFQRSGTAWTEITKLIGQGSSANSYQGQSVALSADGKVAAVGAPTSDSLWVFTRSGTVWSQYGSKLVASDSVGVSALGWSMAVSADGSTIATTGIADNSNTGATWIFARANSTAPFLQDGPKLISTGVSIALSADGKTLAESRSVSANPSTIGVFVRGATAWSQQSVLTGGTYPSLSLSSDGNLLAYPDTMSGIKYYKRAGTAWTPTGNAVAVTGISSQANHVIAMSADGSTTIVGYPYAKAPGDTQGNGGAAVFIP